MSDMRLDKAVRIVREERKGLWWGTALETVLAALEEQRSALADACLASGAPGPHVDPAECREQIRTKLIYLEGTLAEAQAEVVRLRAALGFALPSCARSSA